MRLARVTILLCLAALLAGSSASSRTGAEPQATSAPSIRQDGSSLFLDNGGWFSNSGPVERYVFRWLRDGVLVKGAASVPKSTPVDAVPPAGTYPLDPTANVYPLSPQDAGHSFCGDVWGGTHSRYVTQDGTVAYDVWEYGHTFARDGSQVPLVCLTVPATQQAQPNPGAALAVFENITLPSRRASKLYETWKRDNPGESSKLSAYDQTVLGRQVATPPTMATAIGRAWVGEDQQAAFDAGVHP